MNTASISSTPAKQTREELSCEVSVSPVKSQSGDAEELAMEDVFHDSFDGHVRKDVYMKWDIGKTAKNSFFDLIYSKVVVLG